MNFYERRLKELECVDLPIEVSSDGRNRHELEDDFRNLKVGDKLFPTKWFLRNVMEINEIKNIAINGLTISEVGEIYDREGEWVFGEWRGRRFKCYKFEEINREMSFKNYITQLSWKFEKSTK